MLSTQNEIRNKVNIENCRKDFPIFNVPDNENLVYFDNASTTQKPHKVIETITDFYCQNYSNIHRGLYPLSLNATEQYEHARINIQQFIHAKSNNEILFTKGTTEAINLLAFCLSDNHLKKGDEIIITILEHHSNIVPWQVIANKLGIKLVFIYTNSDGDIDLEKLSEYINNSTKLIAITHISNSIGTINPIEDVIQMAKRKNVLVLVDGAQSVGHMPIDVQKLNCDFFVFSGHKIYGPTGTGVLYIKEEHVEKLNPYQTGGNQIKTVTTHGTVYADSTAKFEPGTPNISGFLGLSAAIDYVNTIGFDAIMEHENDLTKTILKRLNTFPPILIAGNPKNRSGIISFNIPGIHPMDAGILLGQKNICVRTGVHCNEPLMTHLKLDGTIRLSIALYNNYNDIDLFIEKLAWVQDLLSRQK